MTNNFFENKELLEDELKMQVLTYLGGVLKEKGTASILFSGGSTPIGFLEKLAKEDFNWEQVNIGLVDDRMVEEKSEFSNAKMIKDILISKINNSKPKFYPLVFNHKNQKDNTKKLNETIQKLGVPDITILGMGGDGHFASLFPRNRQSDRGLRENNRNLFCYTTAPSEPKERISFTWSFLRKSANLFLFITGEDKLSLIENSNERVTLPIDTLLNDEQIKPSLFWAP